MRTAILIAIASLSACHPAPPAAPAPPLTGDSAQISEAVFRHLFANNASAAQGAASVYCLRVDGPSDPSEALLARFATHRPRVVAVSACTESSDGVFLRGAASGARPGLIFAVGEISIDGDQATATASYFEGGLSAASYGYSLRRTAAGWEVIEQVLFMIS
ncbi:MAG: hypothetical protein IPH44_33780 [Myxococcales bacterium]|jgi:hypothetical protein|nr:hypothetical protein [Myxococcales bacterium]MBK7192701.1 hypothetical protein [Myxococcales bacterium]MBP6845377.1 hypothetical protein [Kofleriaceae bacterium]